MTVVYTGNIPNTISGNTIYVITSWTYTVTTWISMANCSALISSGTVILSGSFSLSWTISAIEKNNIIIENIRTKNNTNGYGIYINSWTNFSMNAIKTYNNRDGIYTYNSSYGSIRNSESYSNTYEGIYLFTSNSILIDNVTTRDITNVGIYLRSSSGNTLSGIESYNNQVWLHFMSSTFNTFKNSIIHDNYWNWIYIDQSSHNNLNNIDSHDNGEHNIDLENSYSNILTTITADTSTAGMWIYLSSSSGNILSGVTTNGNYYAWLYLYNSSYNTGINIVSNSNEWWLYMENSYGNILTTITADTSTAGIWIYLSGSSGNILSWITANGNYYAWLHLYNSSYNTGINIVSNSNEWWLYMENSSGNNFSNFIIHNNTNNGIAFFSWSNYNLLSGFIITGNANHGMYSLNSNNNIIEYSDISNNSSGWVVIETWNNNTILHIIVTGNVENGIYIENGSWNIIDSSNISSNGVQGIWFFLWNSNQIKNSIIDKNNWYGIYAFRSNSTMISWMTLSWNIYGWINIYDSSNILVTNTRDFSSWNVYSSLYSAWWTGNIFTLFSWNRPIVVGISTWLQNNNIDYPLSYIFDSYTKSNNYIIYNVYPYSTLTGNLVIWSQYYQYFNRLTARSDYANHDITLSWVNYFTIGWSTWDGRFYSPLRITTWSKLCTTGETSTNNVAKCIDTMEVISGSSYLTMNGWTGTIDYTVSSWTVWQYLKILKSNDGTTWTNNSVTSWCTLDMDLLCTFDFVWTMKLFAFGIPTSYSFTGYLLSGTVITTGWYYNTGIYITFTGDNLSGATLNGSWYTNGQIITWDGVKIFRLTDIWGNATWMTFTIDTTNPIVTWTYAPSSWSTVTGSSTITFSWSGIETNISGYALYVYQSWTLYATWATTWATSYAKYIGNNTWYTRYVIATDKAGNTGISSTIPFSVNVPLSGVIALSGTTIQLSWSSKYVSSAFPVYLYSNVTCNYTITGDITTGVRSSGILTWGAVSTFYPVASGTDGLKTIYVTLSTGNEYLYQTLTWYLDTTKPTDPTLLTPTSWSITSGVITFTWSWAIDTGVGLSGYRWYISSTGTFATISMSGFTTGVTTTLATWVLGNTGTFYRIVRSLDKLWWSGQSSVWNFYYSGEIFTPTSFSFTSITNARLERTYRSSTGTIAGLSTGTHSLARASRWALYINNVMTGSTWYVKNGDTVNIELISSDEYDTLVSSTLTIGNLSVLFRVTTMEESDDDSDYSDIDTDLSTTEKLQIIAIFETLRDLYDGTKAEEFLNTLMVMLDNNIEDLDEDDTEYDALKYLYDLVEQYYEDQDFWDGEVSAPWIVNGIYTAPNGKRYTITYDSTRRQFTSTNFITPKYFPTLDTLKYLIDISNPVGSQYLNARAILARWWRIGIDGTRQTSPYTAPNRKVYYFFKTIDGKFSSYTFTSEKYFDSLEQVKQYIYTNNR